ncbi:uncharacterized protein DFL_000408 [Arthrobotrys flagrans]|uniref:Uncharacterized protein n=1 Tax=Arthrobotrys flagrans TaxID=97331 RepID=A0A437AF18_ARTFL|nr:hypothetical protein DFL_000408 [Arthrobotrys flagrans]
MSNEKVPPTVPSAAPAVPQEQANLPLNVIKESIAPVHPSSAGENTQAKIRTQVLRGADHLTGLARHEFKRDGDFGAPLPNPPGFENSIPPTTGPANPKAAELDNNICKAEWYKSLVNWPFPYLFENFQQGFLDAKTDTANTDLVAVTKGINFIEDCGIPQKAWEAHAYNEGAKFGKVYMSDRVGPKSRVVTEELDHAKVPGSVRPMEYPRGGFKQFLKRREAEEREAKRKNMNFVEKGWDSTKFGAKKAWKNRKQITECKVT